MLYISVYNLHITSTVIENSVLKLLNSYINKELHKTLFYIIINHFIYLPPNISMPWLIIVRFSVNAIDLLKVQQTWVFWITDVIFYIKLRNKLYTNMEDCKSNSD